MFNVLRQRNFALLWFGQLISLIGDWVLLIALPFHIYRLTGSALATGAMFMASALPSLLLGSVAGVFADRWDRRRMMIVADVLRALALLPLLFVNSAEWIWIVYVVAFATATISQFFMPAKSAIIPTLVGEHELVAANSLNAISDPVTRLIGPSLGGALMVWLGLMSVVWVDVASFLISAVMIGLIALPQNQRSVVEPTKQSVTWTTVWRDWLAGLRLVRAQHMLLMLFVVTGIMGLADAIFTALMVPFAQQVMGITSLEFGWVIAAQGVGGLLGGLLIGRINQRASPIFLLISGGLIDGLVLMCIINFPSLWLAIPLIACAGLPMVAVMVSVNTLLQRNSTDEFRGRVFGAILTTNALMRIIGMLIAGALGDIFSIALIMNIGAALWMVASVMAWLMTREHHAGSTKVVAIPQTTHAK